jgi:hypothetical protein
MTTGRARAALVAAVVLGGCGEVSNDAGAPPLPLPIEARGHQVTPDGIVTNAAIDVNGTLVIVGSRQTADGEMRDGAIVHVAPQGATARFVGGLSNDQLYAVASNGTEILGGSPVERATPRSPALPTGATCAAPSSRTSR